MARLFEGEEQMAGRILYIITSELPWNTSAPGGFFRGTKVSRRRINIKRREQEQG
jgi:hypothetical protein